MLVYRTALVKLDTPVKVIAVSVRQDSLDRAAVKVNGLFFQFMLDEI